MNSGEKYRILKTFIQNKIDEIDEMYHNSVKAGMPTGGLEGEMDLLAEIEQKIIELDKTTECNKKEFRNSFSDLYPDVNIVKVDVNKNLSNVTLVTDSPIDEKTIEDKYGYKYKCKSHSGAVNQYYYLFEY
jgi:hypothetical protein